jgi:hypothetical protein
MMDYRQEEKENTMKKFVIIALATCLLFLVGCSTLARTGATLSAPISQKASTVTTTSLQDSCSFLQARQASFRQDIQSASAELSTAAARGNQATVGQAEKALFRLHWLLAQGQAGLKACPTTR